MRWIALALLCFVAPCPLIAQGIDVEAVLRQFPITLQIEQSNINKPGIDQQKLLQASVMGMAPPTFGVFRGSLNGESHWQFSCKAENTRLERIPCIDMPIGAHRARWVHNRELLEVFAYDSSGTVTLRYLDVTIDPTNPPPADDPVQSLPASPGFFTMDRTKQAYPVLVHVYGAVALSFQVGELPARTNCDISSAFFNRVNVNCTQYPPIPINQGTVEVEASIDGHLVDGMSCDAKWRWSKCAVMGPGFYEARWKDGRHSQIILLGERNSKPEETGFEVRVAQ